MIDQAHHKNDIEGALHMEEINSIRIERLSNKITIFFILLPCLIGGLLVFAYMDLNTKLANLHVKGQTEVKTISDALEGKINSMIVDMAKIKHTLDIKLPEIKKNNDKITHELIKLESIKADKKYVKYEKNKLAASIDILKKKIIAANKANKHTILMVKQFNDKLEKNLKELSLDLKQNIITIQKSMKKDRGRIDNLNQTTLNIKKKLLLIDKQIKIIAQGKIGKKDLDKIYKILNKIQKNRSGQKQNKINNKKNSNTTKISKAKNHKPIPVATGSKTNKQSKPLAKNPKKITKEKAGTESTSIPKITPGKIIEQNLSQ